MQLLSPYDFYTLIPKYSTSGTFSYNGQVAAMHHRHIVQYKWLGQMAECTLGSEASRHDMPLLEPRRGDNQSVKKYVGKDCTFSGCGWLVNRCAAESFPPRQKVKLSPFWVDRFILMASQNPCFLSCTQSCYSLSRTTITKKVKIKVNGISF